MVTGPMPCANPAPGARAEIAAASNAAGAVARSRTVFTRTLTCPPP